MEIVDYLVESVQFFVMGITPYYYEHGVYWEDHNGVRMKYRIQKLIYRDQVQSGVIFISFSVDFRLCNQQIIDSFTADIGEKYLSVICKAARDYTKEIFHKLREREYNPELMRLYVVGGGGCMIQNFGEYDKNRVTIVRDICATAKGYEAMTVRKIQRNGGMLV